MILIATLLADGKYNEERYSSHFTTLRYKNLRFPDGTVSAVCENIPEKILSVRGSNQPHPDVFR